MPATLVRFPDGTMIGARAFGSRREWDKPQFGVYLCSARTRRRIGRDSTVTWRSIWLEWPAFGLPRDGGATTEALLEAHRRARSGQIVELACGSGRTRTGTAVAALAVASGIAPDQAVAWARRHYRRRILVLPWQRRWLARNARRLRDRPEPDRRPDTP